MTKEVSSPFKKLFVFGFDALDNNDPKKLVFDYTRISDNIFSEKWQMKLVDHINLFFCLCNRGNIIEDY